MIVIQGTQVLGDISGHVARLEALIVDLERFTTGQLPSQGELQAAPLLAPHGLSFRPAYCLTGGNHGHPILQGRAIRTSELHIIAPDLRWARTYSRLYRLGERFDPAVQDMLLRGDRE